MAYIYLQHKNFPVAEVGVNSPIPFEQASKGGNIGFNGTDTIKIKESGIYVAHWHIPARLKEILGITPLGLLDGRKRNVLISLTQNGQIIGRSATNVDERSLFNNVIINALIKAIQAINDEFNMSDIIDTDDYNLKQEYSEVISGVCIFRAKKGDSINLKNHSFTGIEIPTHSNSAQCPICAGGTFALYKIDDYQPCSHDDDDDDFDYDDDEHHHHHGCCHD